MKAEKREKWEAIVGPRLEPGEHVEFGLIGGLGKPVSLGKNLAVGAAMAILTLGHASGVMISRPVAFVVTSRRLLIFSTKNPGFAPNERLIGALALGCFRLDAAQGLGVRLNLVTDDGKAVGLRFGTRQKEEVDELVRRCQPEP